MKSLDHVAAVNNQYGGQILGHLHWFSIHEGLYTQASINDAIAESGLDAKLLRDINPKHAFQRATKDNQKRVRISADEVHNYMIRGNFENDKHLIRYVVLEKEEKRIVDLDYDTAIATLRFNKHTLDFEYSYKTPEGAKIAKDIERTYQLFRTHRDANAIRNLVDKAISKWSPTLIRSNGGVYFIPVQFEDQLKALVKFLKIVQVKQGRNPEGAMIPMINTEDNLEIVGKAVEEALKDTVDALRNALINEGNLENYKKWKLLADAKKAISDFQTYQQILGNLTEDMEVYVDFLRRQAARLGAIEEKDENKDQLSLLDDSDGDLVLSEELVG